MTGRATTRRRRGADSWTRALIAALILGSPSAAQAQAQREERAVGGQRLCRYTAPRIVGPRQRERAAVVGHGEPCPATLPRPTTRAAAAPSLATLSGEDRRGTRTVCRYSLSGREYQVERPGGACPLTPNLF